MKLIDYLGEDVIKLDCHQRSREKVIRNLIDFAAERTGKIKDKEKVYQSLIQKDQLESCEVGHNLAILHARDNSIDGLVAAMGICKPGLKFNSRVKNPAKIILLVASNQENYQSYLEVLADISHIFHNDLIKDKILRADTQREIINTLKNWNPSRI
jgi:mannitol/fructose-specific phosphotransferase system IIA component (Ntr-type)